MSEQTPTNDVGLSEDARYFVRSVQSLCFFCFAIGIVVAPLVSTLVRSFQFQNWMNGMMWAAVLGFLIAILCYVVWRNLRVMSDQI